MGVHGLVSFVENYNGDRLVNIKVKARRSQRSKVLVIDLLAMQYKFYQSFDLYNGGDSLACTEGWRTFITDLEKAKIKPIFVVDGSVPKTKRQEWIRRRYENVKKSINPIFDALKNGEYPDEDKIDSCVLPNMMFVDLIKYELGYSDIVFFSSPTQDGDKACVAMAEKHNAFGILTQDSDFLIYQYKPDIHLFSIKHLDFETLNTLEYDRFALARHLGLRIDQLPMLATLKGNDHIHFTDMKGFHSRLTGSIRVNPHAVIGILSDIIRNEDLSDLEEVAYFVFKDKSRKDDLEKSIQSYFLTEADLEQPLGTSLTNDDDENENEVTNEIEMKWNRLINMKRIGTKVHSLMTGAPFDSSTCLEDYRNTSLPSVANLLRGVRQRLYGILFYEKPNALNDDEKDFVYEVTEWCMTGPGSLNAPKMVRPILPPKHEHPGLEALWQNKGPRKYESFVDKTEDSYYQRWRLFSHVVHPRLDPLLLESLKPEDIFMVCQLYIMQHEWTEGAILADWEVKSFILMHLRLKCMTMATLESIVIDFVPKPRPVQLATIYTRSISGFISNIVGEVIKRRHFLTCNNFEGIVFQTLYKEFKDLGDYQVEMPSNEKSDLDAFYNIVTNNGIQVRGN